MASAASAAFHRDLMGSFLILSRRRHERISPCGDGSKLSPGAPESRRPIGIEAAFDQRARRNASAVLTKVNDCRQMSTRNAPEFPAPRDRVPPLIVAIPVRLADQ